MRLIYLFPLFMLFYTKSDISFTHLQSSKFISTDTINADTLKTKADSIIYFGKKFLGTPYKYGGCSPKGFDCSGFVYYVFKNNGIEIPRSSYEMGRISYEVSMNECKKGDIILFRGTNAKNPRIGHAAIVTSDAGKELTFIHSSSNKKRGGVIISTFNESPYYAVRFVKIVRILK